MKMLQKIKTILNAIYNDVLSIKTGWLLVIYLFVSTLFSFAIAEYIESENLYYEYISAIQDEKYTEYDEYVKDFEEELSEMEDDSVGDFWEDILFDFLWSLSLFLIKVPTMAFLLLLVLMLSFSDIKFAYAKIFKVTLISATVFFIRDFLAIIWFRLIHTEYSYEDALGFSPLYLSSLFAPDVFIGRIRGWIQWMNLYNVVFLLCIALGLRLMYRSVSYRLFLGKVSMAFFCGMILWELLIEFLLR